MSFIQIIEHETDRAAEIDATMRDAMRTSMGEPAFTRLEHTQDHDNPHHFMTIVEFPSYDAAMENSSKPETDEMARHLAELCTSGPDYRNLDVRLQFP